MDIIFSSILLRLKLEINLSLSFSGIARGLGTSYRLERDSKNILGTYFAEIIACLARKAVKEEMSGNVKQDSAELRKHFFLNLLSPAQVLDLE